MTSLGLFGTIFPFKPKHMKFEDERNRRMIEAGEAKIGVLEAYIAKIRARLEKAKDVLTKHEIALSRKEAKGQDLGPAEERVERKREEIKNMEASLEEMVMMAETLRNQVKRLMDFHTVQDTLDNLPGDFVRAKKGEWNIPNSRFKTVEDLFTPAESRVIPARRKGMSPKAYDRLPLDVCPIDPERVPDWLMEEFGWGAMKGKSTFDRLEAKALAAPRIRELFAHVEPLGAYDHQTYRALVIEGYAPEHDGKLIVTSYQSREDEEVDRKIMAVYDDAYAARRRPGHIEGGFERENEKLHGIRGRVTDIQEELPGLKKGDPLSQELQDQLATEFEILGHVTSYYGSQVADILATVSDLKDRSGRYNSTAACMRLLKAIDLISKRLPQIFGKSPYVAEDKRILDVEIKNGTETLDRCRRGYLGICRGLQQCEPKERILQKMDRLPELTDLRIRPFNLYGAKFAEKTAMVKEGLDGNNAEMVRDSAIDAYVAGKVFHLHHEREKILRDIVESPVQVSIASLLKRANELLHMSRSKETFPDIRTGGNEAYVRMRNRLRDAVRGLEHYSTRRMTETERLAMYERLKKFLEDVDFISVLENL